MAVISILCCIVIVYLFQMIICVKMHIANNTRRWTGTWDLIKLTFLPYVLINFKKLEKHE